ncbi:MAG: hypothetical protein QGG24_07405 [Vicinamibacterales bacterium]|jgi:hypothetical protein|nr:hypothetical protein [Acidobacteriota bacterium]MDP7295132.1 hypothetical protein [Vicinamibacterales bacterium]MDP7471457.1 hypothetical protein [Vicinamibacterales bacterium]MDP7672613.1 hypothetical protein [Vicinamibacterales bacterium]HJO37003.1 hypothetical protein [Vicinamibacterales bacterium]
MAAEQRRGETTPVPVAPVIPAAPVTPPNPTAWEEIELSAVLATETSGPDAISGEIVGEAEPQPEEPEADGDPVDDPLLQALDGRLESMVEVVATAPRDRRPPTRPRRSTRAEPPQHSRGS